MNIRWCQIKLAAVDKRVICIWPTVRPRGWKPWCTWKKWLAKLNSLYEISLFADGANIYLPFLTQTSTVRPLLEVGLSYYHFSGGASTYPSCRNIHSMSYSNTLQRNLQTAFSPTFSYFSVFLQCTIIILHLRRWNHLCRKSATCFVFSHWKATKTLIVNLKCVKDLQLDRFSTFIIVSW